MQQYVQETHGSKRDTSQFSRQVLRTPTTYRRNIEPHDDTHEEDIVHRKQETQFFCSGSKATRHITPTKTIQKFYHYLDMSKTSHSPVRFKSRVHINNAATINSKAENSCLTWDDARQDSEQGDRHEKTNKRHLRTLVRQTARRLTEDNRRLLSTAQGVRHRERKIHPPQYLLFWPNLGCVTPLVHAPQCQNQIRKLPISVNITEQANQTKYLFGRKAPCILLSSIDFIHCSYSYNNDSVPRES